MERFNQRVLLANAESSYGVDPTLTGSANAMLAFDVEFNPDAAEMVPRDYVKPTPGNVAQNRVLEHCTLAFSVELAGSGDAGTAPPWNPMILACGFDDTIVSETSVTYELLDPAATAGSVALEFYAGTTLHQVLGWRGSVALQVEPNRKPLLRFAGQGFYVAPASDTVPSQTLTAWQTGLFLSDANSNFTLHGTAAALRSLSLDLRNQVVHRDYVNLKEMQITDRDPTGQVVIEAPAIATKNWWAIAAAETLGALAFVHGTAAGNIVTINAPKVQLLNPQYADQENARHLQMGLNLAEDSGNDELEIVLT